MNHIANKPRPVNGGDHWISSDDIDYYDCIDGELVLALMYCATCNKHEWHWIDRRWMQRTKPLRWNPNVRRIPQK